MMRLDKYLAEMGVGTRQEVKKQIRQGKAAVNGTVVKAADTKIDETSDEVTISGRNISYVSYEYYMLNKPAGVVSATEDRRDTTVIDLIKEKKRKDLFPVGRLDKDTEGLLLITNDGELAHRLLSPAHHVDKQYYALVVKECDTDDSPVPVLKVSQYPLPAEEIQKMADCCKYILVVEDGQPFVEEQVKALLSSDYTVKGRLTGDLPRTGELTPDNVGNAIGWATKSPFVTPQVVMPRPPALCQGALCRQLLFQTALLPSSTVDRKSVV